MRVCVRHPYFILGADGGTLMVTRKLAFDLKTTAGLQQTHGLCERRFARWLTEVRLMASRPTESKKVQFARLWRLIRYLGSVG